MLAGPGAAHGRGAMRSCSTFSSNFRVPGHPKRFLFAPAVDGQRQLISAMIAITAGQAKAMTHDFASSRV